MNLDGAKILVTGGCGLIGSTTIDQILAHESPEEIVIFDNLVRGSMRNVEQILKDPRVRLVKGDIRDRAAIETVTEGMAAVLHMAAIRITACAAEPREAMEVMNDGTYNVIEAAHKANVQRVLAASSASIYGMADTFPTTERHHPYNNDTWYGASKVMLEGLFRSFHAMYGLDYVAMRYFNVYGERQQGGSPYAGVIGNWIHALHFKKPLTVYGDGEQTRDFVHVEDIARANIKAVDAITSEFHTYNVCSGTNTRLNDVLSILGDEVVESFRINNEDARQGEVKDSIGNNTRALVGLEWAPAINLREGIRRTLKWRGVR